VVCHHAAADGVAASGLTAAFGRPRPAASGVAGNPGSGTVAAFGVATVCPFADAFAEGVDLLTYLEFPQLSRGAYDLGAMSPFTPGSSGRGADLIMARPRIALASRDDASDESMHYFVMYGQAVYRKATGHGGIGCPGQSGHWFSWQLCEPSVRNGKNACI
jgi:hypothetical protein